MISYLGHILQFIYLQILHLAQQDIAGVSTYNIPDQTTELETKILTNSIEQDCRIESRGNLVGILWLVLISRYNVLDSGSKYIDILCSFIPWGIQKPFQENTDHQLCIMAHFRGRYLRLVLGCPLNGHAWSTDQLSFCNCITCPQLIA